MAPVPFPPPQYPSTDALVDRSARQPSTPGSNVSSTSDPGPSTKKPSPQKRKRIPGSLPPDQDTPSPDDHDTDDKAHDHHPEGKHRDGPKKKKASRACALCQKAHLTCDDSRPCQRCVRRGVSDACVEGHRKKAKYLLDEEELEAMKKSKEQAKHKAEQQAAMAAQGVPNTSYMDDSNQLFDLSFDPSYTFGSQAANLEYSILSAILGNPPSDSQSGEANEGLSGANSIADTSSWQPSSTNTSMSRPMPLILQQSTSPNQSQVHTPNSMSVNLPPYQGPNSNEQVSGIPDLASVYASTSSSTNTSPAMPSLSYPPTGSNSTNEYDSRPGGRGAGTVYDQVTRPYDYKEGYHFLMKYLHDRFEKNDILRVVRALAIVRPSLIALQMPLTNEDEVFVEKAFQRTLQELEKLISFSGTPTVVWRRTGEICLVGVEFTVLTEWSRRELLSSKKFIYELFENQSVVEYWEQFAQHAFENSTQSVYSHCVLLKPSGEPVPCAFCFSIRRDIFDLPNVIIGQWLPLL
ncbi:hypothetical protein BOTBODRAFT_25699 [Botryobasidium botryosum FD-172 SS1]|uniref:Transcription activator of gluconeogenesis ERT1 n=1 Tax=Botryobasidium botryosum (strain FD-172 SS1) TaxID=930990 RepID=A0A067NAY7_BOTB1|nr:hypothetical protein BOTBODRAFT_25699 [Botryobasidium botryosum FD-172 SS1]